jgi:hypothetical protein
MSKTDQNWPEFSFLFPHRHPLQTLISHYSGKILHWRLKIRARHARDVAGQVFSTSHL